MKKNNVVIYQNGEIELKVSVDKESIWLRAEDIATLFNVQRPAIVKHIGNIYKTDELIKNSTCSILEQLTKDRKKRNAQYNNLKIKTSNRFHDRFLIIDKKELYHIGASLKDLGKKVFAFSRMNIDSFNLLEITRY